MSIDDARDLCSRVARSLLAHPAMLGATYRTHRCPHTGEIYGRYGLTANRLATWVDDERPPCVTFWRPESVCRALDVDVRDLRAAIEIVREWRDSAAGRKVHQAKKVKRAQDGEAVSR